MAEQTQKQIKKPLNRCGERVMEARIIEAASTFVLGGNPLTVADRGGTKVEAMWLHPAGLLVVPTVGPHKGKRVMVPAARVEYALIADEET